MAKKNSSPKRKYLGGCKIAEFFRRKPVEFEHFPIMGEKFYLVSRIIIIVVLLYFALVLIG